MPRNPSEIADRIAVLERQLNDAVALLLARKAQIEALDRLSTSLRSQRLVLQSSVAEIRAAFQGYRDAE
jgi:hypothetical protein